MRCGGDASQFDLCLIYACRNLSCPCSAWRPKDVPAFDAEVGAMEMHGIRLVAWWFPTDAAHPAARTILEVTKRHGNNPQLWVMSCSSHRKTTLRLP